MPEPHQHQFRLHAHIDGCHFWQSIYTCPCGAVETRGAERDFLGDGDPYSAVWVVDECKRCQELLEGAKPRELV